MRNKWWQSLRNYSYLYTCIEKNIHLFPVELPEESETMERIKVDNKAIKTVMSIMWTTDIQNRYLEIELLKHGSSPKRFAVMNALVVHDNTMTPSTIAKWLFHARHTITMVLRVLDGIRFIRREPGRSDGRSVNTTVTKKC